MEKIQYFSKCFLMQWKLVPKLTLGPFLTLSFQNGPNLQSYLFQAYISLNSSKVQQNYTMHLLKMAKTNYWNKKCQLQTNNKLWELVFDDIGFHFRTYPAHVMFSEHILVLRQLLLLTCYNYSNSYQCQFLSIHALT